MCEKKRPRGAVFRQNQFFCRNSKTVCTFFFVLVQCRALGTCQKKSTGAHLTSDSGSARCPPMSESMRTSSTVHAASSRRPRSANGPTRTFRPRTALNSCTWSRSSWTLSTQTLSRAWRRLRSTCATRTRRVYAPPRSSSSAYPNARRPRRNHRHRLTPTMQTRGR